MRSILLVIALYATHADAKDWGNRRDYTCTGDHGGGAEMLFNKSKATAVYSVNTGSYGVRMESYMKHFKLEETGLNISGNVWCLTARTLIPGPPSEWFWRCAAFDSDQLRALSAGGYPFEDDNCN